MSSDFSWEEYKRRTIRAQQAMANAGIDALCLTTEPEFRYFSGFRTLFWQSPTRSWFLVLPQEGVPIAVIPKIGADLMSRTWVEDIRTFAAPSLNSEGKSLVLNTLKPYSRIGIPMSGESRLGIPLADFNDLRRSLSSEFIDVAPLLEQLRQIKSPAEISQIQLACDAASSAFRQAPELFYQGQSLAEVFRAFKLALLQAGAEEVPYLVGAAGLGGYQDIISPAGKQTLENGDILILDTGATVAGYHCDFDRNFAFGDAPDDAKRAYDTLYGATEAGLAVAKPGAQYRDVFHAMARVITEGGYGDTLDVGRFGHGLGMQLTETPSVVPWEATELQPGMVLTLEPSLRLSGLKTMVHEENIVITESGCRLLSERSAPHLPVLSS